MTNLTAPKGKCITNHRILCYATETRYGFEYEQYISAALEFDNDTELTFDLCDHDLSIEFLDDADKVAYDEGNYAAVFENIENLGIEFVETENGLVSDRVIIRGVILD